MKNGASGRSALAGLILGARCLAGGARLVYLEHRELLWLAALPMLIAALLAIGGVLFWVAAAGRVAGWIWSDPGAEAWGGVLHVLWLVFRVLVWLMLALATLLLANSSLSVLAAPFGDALSERIERLRGSWEPRPFSLSFAVRDALQGLALAAARALARLAWMVPLVVLSLVVPVVGPAIGVVAGAYLLGRSNGLDYIDWPAARRGYGWRERLRFAARHRAAVTGLGLAVAAAWLVPVAFVLVWPAAVAGGTLLFTRLHEEESGASQ